jgi:adenine-specific DNA-methyltransferase
MEALDRRREILTALRGFEKASARDGGLSLLNALGYISEKQIRLRPNTAAQFQAEFDPAGRLNPRYSVPDQWKSIDFLFQLTDEEIAASSRGQLAFSQSRVDDTAIESYLFFALELSGETYNRTTLAGIAREINKLFPMPAMVLFRYGKFATLAVIDRKIHKRDESKDTLHRVTLIKDIDCTDPLRAHIDILAGLSFDELYQNERFHNWVGLHRAWQKQLDTRELNERFYTDIANWYFWALQNLEVVYPRDVTSEEQRSLFFIRLITRLIFCWFLQEKNLVPRALFRPDASEKFLKRGGTDHYYNAILQNLFFATLNQETDKRAFAGDRGKAWYDQNRKITTLYRHAELLNDPEAFLKLLRSVPFVNGGLFDCLDDKPKKTENREAKILDGFSRNSKESTVVPDEVFFGSERTVDLSKFYETKKRAKVRGLIETLSRYKFTVEENTPLDQEVALDPELLGKVFENLLASYNPDTRTTARKKQGAFYTPREVVHFMVDEALIAHFSNRIKLQNESVELEGKLRQLFASSTVDFSNPLTQEETEWVISAINEVKILDPACGSGAFPMGALQRLVDLLAKLDPNNRRWKEQQRQRAVGDLKKAESELQFEGNRDAVLPEMESRIKDIESSFDTRFHDLDFARKLYLLENSIFGVDIEPIACQIAKLRFFIALLVDQRVDPKARNSGVRPLPNLETRIVVADALVPIQQETRFQLQLGAARVDELRAQLNRIRHDIFNARTPEQKAKLRERDATLRGELSGELGHLGMPTKTARLLAGWDPYDQNTHAPFFDPDWMFAVKEFDVVIGNPPYVRQEQIKDLKPTLKQYFDCYTGAADLYVYFYERGIRLLKVGGVFSFITSNKWFRSGYGKALRTWLGANAKVERLIDFGDAEIFDAIAYPCIIILSKVQPDKADISPTDTRLLALNWDPDWNTADLAKVINERSFQMPQSGLLSDGWRLEGTSSRLLLQRLTRTGIPLGKYVENKLYRGILTGLNDAFVVDQAIRDTLIEEHPSSDALLKPFLRGRDVKRWRTEFADQYLIKIESSENKDHPWSGKSEVEAERTFAATYPAIYRRLTAPETRRLLIDRYDQGAYFWELRSCVYWQQFERPKIVIPAIADRVNYAPDNQGFYSNDKTSIALPPSVPFCLAILNSQVSWWFTRQIFATKQGGFYEFKPMYVSQIPIPQPPEKQRQLVERVAEYLTLLYADPVLDTNGPMTSYFEQLLNGLVYELFFEQELRAEKLFLFEYLGQASPLKLGELSKANQKSAITEFYEKIADLNHPIRSCLFSLRSLEVVRIVEGE